MNGGAKALLTVARQQYHARLIATGASRSATLSSTLIYATLRSPQVHVDARSIGHTREVVSDVGAVEFVSDRAIQHHVQAHVTAPLAAS